MLLQRVVLSYLSRLPSLFVLLKDAKLANWQPASEPWRQNLRAHLTAKFFSIVFDLRLIDMRRFMFTLTGALNIYKIKQITVT